MTSSGSAAPELRIVGLMSGTSADGIDAALVRVSGAGEETRFVLERFLSIPYSSDVRESLLDMARNYAGTHDIASWHFRLGDLLAAAVEAVLGDEEADLVASHGHTAAHLAQGGTRATLQLGAPAVIAERTGLTVISDFRSADIAAGGEGAPLVSYLDAVCLRHPQRSRAFVNVGGIANLTFVPAAGSLETPRAFDTGPGNAMIDRAAYRLSGETKHCDVDGAGAERGVVNQDVLAWLLRRPYFKRRPPKSTGREEFGDGLANQAIDRVLQVGGAPEDALATLTAFTVKSIVRGMSWLPALDEVIVSGGGVHNQTLMRHLREELAGVPILTSEEVGIPPDAKEALAFAILANQTIRGLPSNLPACTGARHQAVLGSITPGRNYPGLVRRLLP